jgi:predicted nucleotidyltransferase component of viral defense system
MVEQDLIISRIVVELFSDPFLRDALIFRGGTALSKLCFPRPLRYSEDVDLVQREAAPIGPVFDAVRRALDCWLGEKPARKQGPGVVNLVYRAMSEDVPPMQLRIKIEINTREHFRVLPIVERCFRVESRWFHGEARVPVYAIEELLGTKLRALYQRRKGRDLFDLAAALRELSPDTAAVVETFHHYMAEEGRRITGDEFRANLAAKLGHPGFAEDCGPLLKPGTVFNPEADAKLVEERLLSLLPDSRS